ncbi:hypothetical protein ANCDUO_12885, partial [Ancylostoma duodenale]
WAYMRPFPYLQNRDGKSRPLRSLTHPSTFPCRTLQHVHRPDVPLRPSTQLLIPEPQLRIALPIL